MADAEVPSPRRSSSQASSASCRSRNAKTVRAKMQKRHSGSSNTTTDLTSFPSLSPPDQSPTLPRGLVNTLHSEEDGGHMQANERVRGRGDHTRGRKATLANLTGGLSHNSGRAALFADSIPRRDIPGALHLADDAHIERLISGSGATNLVRQFARDLAQRDAEISALRQRADARERELKRMLREVSVSNQDIERRLYQMENPPVDRTSDAESTHSHSSDPTGQDSSGLNGLMSQAMEDAVGSRTCAEPEPQATIRPLRSNTDTSGSGLTDNRKRQSSIRGWQEYIFGSTNTSRKTSRASSLMSEAGETEADIEGLRLPMNPAMRRKALDEQLFQPPNDPARSGTARRIASTSTNGGDDASIDSRKSSRSFGSWTIKLFAGNSQAGKDGSDSESISNKPQPQRPDGDKSASSTLSGNSKGGLSAVAALKRINSNASLPNSTVRSASGSSTQGKMGPPPPRRTPAGSVSQGATSETTEQSSTNLGPVEMDAILPLESKPPTLTPIYNNAYQGEFLTDSFGFIYDQRRNKRQREAAGAKSSNHRLSITETLGTLRTDISDLDDDFAVPAISQAVPGTLNSLPGSPDDLEGGAVAISRWQDYLRVPNRPTELLSHTPSAGPIISLTPAADSRSHSSSVSVDKDGALAVGSSVQPSASTSAVTANKPEFAGLSSDQPRDTTSSLTPADIEPVKLLLRQLADLHDTSQRDRTVGWNEFLRKVRAERRKEGEAAAASSDRSVPAFATPETSLADGEVVGIAGLGNKGKVGRAKWREFRMLVLGGIPIALRAKVWSECSGASAMRIPGYYDDLVRGVGDSEPDSSVVAQIDMDIRRTLTDNVFFRKGPGVDKLKEVLLAYSRRNPEVGYCQGMNLIAGSLLLILPTAEDAFWILASMIEIILPEHYYDHGLLASRADQVVLRQYITELLPKLSAHLEELGIELEALTFQWFLSVFTDCLSAEALYRVWDVILCLNVTTTDNGPGSSGPIAKEADKAAKMKASADIASGSGGGSTFLFQVALALLKLNEQQLLTTCSTPAALYTYINHQMTNHAISIDGLIHASEALRKVVRREDVVARRAVALEDMRAN
ncbi:unnamed protein product [Penicillium salamii]|uniref:Rab-GAP TBC domain-containing protein n=1 Tax=Penicillium salamii TaxID=1612424 RepID=A0A9W4NP82_9EURO|nr:unnamed protein product [Penicillium salamii]CAG8073927.1 unnamed protein product [Penicillium salamii]CAG8121433.1 unnamed protein product [Penicillium salamii]CAG8134520.1 unnamed protein product [Penicillium salamii]CAG8301502.1 unnamed protein product [Penicillium salamii]